MKKGIISLLLIITIITIIPTLNVTANNTNIQIKAVYCAVNKKTKDRIYTSSKNEIKKLNKKKWTYEGIRWYAPKSGKKVYRLYNKKTKRHFYTTNKKVVKKYKKKKWKLQKKGLFKSGGPLKVYQFYNKKKKSYAYSLNGTFNGYIKKGIVFYAYKYEKSTRPETDENGHWINYHNNKSFDKIYITPRRETFYMGEEIYDYDFANIGEKILMYAEKFPSDTSNKDPVTWTSSNPNAISIENIKNDTNNYIWSAVLNFKGNTEDFVYITVKCGDQSNTIKFLMQDSDKNGRVKPYYESVINQ